MGDHPFMDLLSSACKGEYGVSIEPTPGMALQFEHILVNGSYNVDTWHDGCNVLSGAKITLQKFKELPLEQRQPGDQVRMNPMHLFPGGIYDDCAPYASMSQHVRGALCFAGNLPGRQRCI